MVLAFDCVSGWNPEVWPFKWKLLSRTFLWCCLLCCTRWFQRFESVDVLVKCDQFYERYREKNLWCCCYAVQGESLDIRKTPEVRPLNWKLLTSSWTLPKFYIFDLGGEPWLFIRRFCTLVFTVWLDTGPRDRRGDWRIEEAEKEQRKGKWREKCLYYG